MRNVSIFANFDMDIKKKALYSKGYRAFGSNYKNVKKCGFIRDLSIFS